MFECERTVNWTWKLKLCVGTQVLGIVLMLAFITTIIVLILTRLPEDGGIILVTVLVVFVLVGCLVGVIITVLGSIKRAVNESSSIVSLNLITWSHHILSFLLFLHIFRRCILKLAVEYSDQKELFGEIITNYLYGEKS